MKLLISFPDPSPSFVHGVEFGRLLGKMEAGDPNVQNCGFPVHVANREVIQEACRVYGYIACFGAEPVEGWVDFFAIKKTYLDN